MSNRSSLQSEFKETFLHPFYIARKSLFSAIKENAKYAHGILLDVGCGKKPYYELFYRRVQEYLGLDLSSSKEKTIDIFADELHLPFKSNSFDTVLSTEMIEHIPEPKVLLDEIHRVLKKEGILILSAPQVWGLHSEPKDFFRFTKYGLKYLGENKLSSAENSANLWLLGLHMTNVSLISLFENKANARVYIPMEGEG